MGRRISKAVYDPSDLSSPTSDLRYTYDGWNLISEVSSQGSEISTNQYVWGLDLSGSMQGAGGIGGLLSRSSVSGLQSTVSFYAYDANGNVTDLVDTNGTTVGHYEYDAFGNTTVKTGTMADGNPFRFSTKYQDDETELYYYGYRYYSPELGRWVNRDPIEERGGGNVYGFVRNGPQSNIDFLGQYDPDDPAYGPSFPSVPGPGGVTHYITPPWFNYPSDEGKPCCCEPPATLVKFDRSDAGSGMTHIDMQVDIEVTGCYKDLKWLWWTCIRPDDTSGIVASCGINSSTCSFGGIPPYFASYLTTVKLRYLSCENNVWVKKTHSRGVGYVWHWTPIPPHYGPM
jgi:RHS repeat-associated protein